MFENNWSAEEIEQVLAEKLGSCGHGDILGRSRSDAPAGASRLGELAGVIEKMSGLLENQSLFRAEIDSLRKELQQSHTERVHLEKRHQDRICLLEKEIEELRHERAQMLHEMLEHLNKSSGPQTAPPDAFLRLPLVVRKGDDEYLGVAGRTRHFSLQEFLRIIQRNGFGRKRVALAWRREPGEWVLTINTCNLESADKHEHVLHVRQTMTPNHNNVVELTSLCIDGNHVPEPFLLVLLRKIKDGFDE